MLLLLQFNETQCYSLEPHVHTDLGNVQDSGKATSQNCVVFLPLEDLVDPIVNKGPVVGE